MAAPARGDAERHADMLEMRGELNLLNQRLDSSIQALSGNVSALGAEMHLLRGLQESGQALLMEKMGEVGSTSLQLRLLTDSIREHNALEKARQETTERQIGELRDKESHARGERRGAAFVLTLLVALIGYVYVADKTAQAETNAAFQRDITTNRAMLLTHDAQVQAMQRKLGQ